MSCSSVVAGCGSIPPVVPVGTTNPLGAFGPQCCRGPCPSLELIPVEICVQVNSSTSVTFKEVCLVDSTTCTFSSADWGITQDSWGRKCRTVSFQRSVPSNKYIQLSFCAFNPCVGCTWSAVDNPPNIPTQPLNALTKIRIGGVDYLSALQALYSSELGAWPLPIGVCGSIVPCAIGGPIGGCCAGTYDDNDFTSLQNIPGGAVITLGPVGSISLSI
jgi:hypothetical protein